MTRLVLFFFIFIKTFSFNASSQEDNSRNEKSGNKSMYTIGYQIGGHTYLGINYEYRILEQIGIHFGLGYSGYTAGIKLHLNDCIECPQLNISFKDGGFGEIGTFGAEFAARLFTLKKGGKLATYAQFGYGYITFLSEKKRQELFGNKSAPEGIFTFGIGLNFW